MKIGRREIGGAPRAGPTVSADGRHFILPDGRAVRRFAPDGVVLREFMASPAPVKVIQGPIGSGKSLACAMLIWMKAGQQHAQGDGVRRCRAHVFRTCYDDQTEILTERRGWQLFKNLRQDDKVAQLNGDALEFVLPSMHYAAPYVGEMIGYEGEGVDFRVTPDHRMWVSPIYGRAREWLPYRFMTAEECYEQDVRVRRDAAWSGEPTAHSEAMFEWLGLWFAEGYGAINKAADGYARKVLVLTQCKPDGMAYARRLFEQAGIAFTENSRSDGGINFRVTVCPANAWLFAELCGLGGALRKAVPVWVKSAPAGHQRAFLRGFIAGDGYTDGKSIFACTSSPYLADDLQEMALKAGWVANKSRGEMKMSLASNGLGIIPNGPAYKLTFVTDKKYRPRLNYKYKPRKQYRNWYRERYSGWVYCVEVPTHIVYVRRNGKAFWCSQTYGKLEETTLKTWLDWFPEREFGHFFRSRPYRHEIRVPGIELDVHFVALEDEWSADFFRSLETTICWFNEVQYMDRALFDEAVTRVGRYPRVIDGGAVGPQVIADMNAPDELHWVPIMRGDVAAPDWFTEEQRRAHVKPPPWQFFVQPPGLLEERDGEGTVTGYRPNPAAENMKFLPPGYYENAAHGKTKAWVDANILNRVSPRRHGKPVLRDFNRSVHVAREPLRPIEGLKVLIGTDHGRRPCAIFGQYLRGRWYILHELVTRDMGTDRFAPLLRKEFGMQFPGWESNYQIWGDPSGDFKGQNDEQTPFRILRAHGFAAVREAPSFLFTVRLQAMEATFTRFSEGKPDILISPTCPMLIAALDGGWHFRRLKVAGEKYAEEPEKDEYSDPADALGYLLLGGGEGRAVLTGGKDAPKPVQTRVAYNPFKPNVRAAAPVRGW